jgi:hypothetical protein
MLNIMHFLLRLCWVISSSAHLEREVKAMLLLLASVHSYQIQALLPEQQITRVSEISCIKVSLLLI